MIFYCIKMIYFIIKGGGEREKGEREERTWKRAQRNISDSSLVFREEMSRWLSCLWRLGSCNLHCS